MNSKPEHIAYLDLITKKLSDEISVEEDRLLADWLNKNEENKKLFDSYRATWDEMDRVKGKSSIELDEEWMRLENTIDFDEPIHKQQERPLFRNVYRYAAALLFLVLAGFAMYYLLRGQRSQLLIAEAQIREVAFSEGSRATVNSYSKLIYPKRFEKDHRVVELSGEAFFEIAEDPERPFIIEAGEITVEVLGTSFNVKAYENQEKIEVTVSTGKVVVYEPENLNKKVVLVQGHKAVFYRSTTKIKTSINNDINFNAWKTRQIIFEDTPMPEVIRIINEIYKTDIGLEGSRLDECPVTTTFDNQSLESILNVLESTLDLKIEKEDGHIQIYGEGC